MILPFQPVAGIKEKKIKSILLIMSENILYLCINNYELLVVSIR
jgi:hypothetical protein